jgi:hypothetical protein
MLRWPAKGNVGAKEQRIMRSAAYNFKKDFSSHEIIIAILPDKR